MWTDGTVVESTAPVAAANVAGIDMAGTGVVAVGVGAELPFAMQATRYRPATAKTAGRPSLRMRNWIAP
jgi:hypothetical protein